MQQQTAEDAQCTAFSNSTTPYQLMCTLTSASHVVPPLTQQMGCKTGQAVTLRSSLHFLPTQVLHHITGHNTHHYLITGESTRITQQGELLWVACGYCLWRQGGLGEDRVMVHVQG